MFKRSLFLFSFTFGALQAYANHQTVSEFDDNSVTVQIPSATEEGKLRTLKLLKLIPTPEQISHHQKTLDEKKYEYEKDYSKGITSFEKSAGAKDLGMNGTPVLDQGQYNTCATFGMTTFLDGYIGKGDYIDQQCLLALSKTVGQNYWNGAFTPDIFYLLKDYGIVEKGECFGETYPNQQQYVYPEEYLHISHREYLRYKSLQRYSVSVETVKRALNAGDRVLLTVNLLANSDDAVSVNGFEIIVDGEKKKGGGLWACSQPSSYTNYCSRMNAGHAVTVIGYDDAQRLFKIRNSWGDAYGDNGDYYMTYEFLYSMGQEVAVLKGYNH